jgi:hypothetical protein
MIQVWFNERGYAISSDKGDSHFIYDLPPDCVNDAMALYNCRWMIMNQLLDALRELGEITQDKDLALNTDSRLIEELQGELTPQNEFAHSSLRYFIKYDYCKFSRVTFTKCAATTINDRLNEFSVITKR